MITHQMSVWARHQGGKSGDEIQWLKEYIAAIGEVLNYAKTTVREMEVLGLPPDEHTLEMATLMPEGGSIIKFSTVGIM